MTNNFHDLITRMANELDEYRRLLLDDCTVTHRLSNEARAALADEPAVPEVVGSEWQPCVKLPLTVHVREQRPGEQHVLTREGITPVQPDDLIMLGVDGEEYPIGRELFQRTYRMGSADEPAVPEGREPASVTKQPSDEEIIAFWSDHCAGDGDAGIIRLARWGHQPAPPADGEVAELVEWLQEEADDYECIGCEDSAAKCNRAAELLGEVSGEHSCTGRTLEEVVNKIGRTLEEVVNKIAALLPAHAALAEADGPAVPESREPASVVAESSDEEVAELTGQLIEAANGAAAMGWDQHAQRILRAAELLERQVLVPVSVSERPWEREGWCDVEGRFWAEHISRSGVASWRCAAASDLGGWAVRCLPAHALPLPEVGE